MDVVTVVLLVINLLLWPALGYLALRTARKDPEIEQLERQLKTFTHHRENLTNPFQDAA
ncbi:hypothetical protein [Deinococcus roseus]|uniref:hypothetical protein n=1 Tax=Deinococcus roseus TaxID=392414 RepID=UPI001664744F|nr:hypothetical protein [Deinococcus roseus]